MENLTVSNLAALATIFGVIFATITTLVKLLVEFLASKFNSPIINEQPERCKFDHKEINQLIVQQNANIFRMLEQNGEQIKALNEGNHNAQLRHQIVVSELEKIKEFQNKNSGR